MSAPQGKSQHPPHDDDAFYKIHHINPVFNRVFSFPLYVVSFIIVVLFVVSPYRVRVAISLLINVLFNRPLVYLSYFSKLIARPMNAVMASALYVVLLGAYALPMKMIGALRGKGRPGEWRTSSPVTSGDQLYFQS